MVVEKEIYQLNLRDIFNELEIALLEKTMLNIVSLLFYHSSSYLDRNSIVKVHVIHSAK